MKTSKIMLGFSRLSDGQLEDQALAIASAMTANKNFTDPKPGLEELNNSIQLFSEALALSKTRDKVKVAIKNELRANLERLLPKLANYCTYIANGDRALLSSSGFKLNTETSTAKIVGAPQNFTVQNGSHSGEMLVYINRLPNAKSYLFLYGPSPISNGAWIHAVNSLPYFTITGLTPGASYSFKIGATGSKGQVVYTDTVTKMVV